MMWINFWFCFFLYLYTIPMEFSIMFWNVQGASSPEFRRAFKTISKNYFLNMVVIVEPRCSGKQADDFILSSGFGWSHRVEAKGFAGGIWLLWQDNFTVTIFKNHSQFVHFRVDDGKSNSSYITAVYASPIRSNRNFLWRELSRLANNVTDPWLIGGDFNSFLHNSEKKCGSQRYSSGCPMFNGWINDFNLYDLGFKGPKFTWSRGTVHERLDRVICDNMWLHMHPDNAVLHLPKLKSDHRPILVKFNNGTQTVGSEKPFRFLASWLTVPNFEKVVRDRWEVNANYLQAVERFIDKIKVWNRDELGIFFIKRSIFLLD